MAKKTTAPGMDFRPPIVAVLGHVDHGKTTLLDTIRKAHVAQGEHGGITQHIGAYQISLKAKASSLESKITFIDTPGHEAFAAMRSRGAKVADIALLVVAADDSVKPQTLDSIRQIKDAGVQMVVVINKVDLPTANIDRVKQDLAKHSVQVEGFGGDIPVALVSAKQGTGVPELLDLILLLRDMKELRGDAAAPLDAVVIETRLDKGKGMVATIVVKQGSVVPGAVLFEGDKQVAKIRAMFDEHGVGVKQAGPSTPVEILGFTTLPQVGSVLHALGQASSVPVDVPAAFRPNDVSAVPDFLKPIDQSEKERLQIILKADTSGSLEAILAALDPRIRIVGTGVGDVNEADVLNARSTKSLIIGFNVKSGASVEKLAQAEKVVIRVYRIIYELLDELAEVAEGLKEVITRERELGVGKIIAEFPYEGMRVAGTKVLSGRLVRGDMVKIMRDEEEIGRSKVKSIRQGKNDVSRAEAGVECGVLLVQSVDFFVGDGIIAVTTG